MTRKDAMFAAYRAQSVASRDTAAAALRMRVYLHSGVQEYGPEEIAAVQANPGEFGMKAFSVKAGTAVRTHRTWDGMDVAWMFERDHTAV